MTLKDGGGEAISKRVLDWLTGVGAIATLLATIFGLFLDEKNARLYAFGAAVLLATASSGVYFYQRRRAAKLKIAESLEPLSATASLRGLLPFEEGDQLPGRSRDVQELYTLVVSSSFRFGVLWGESGCGKTSLLRAGLVPKLRTEKFLPLYINKPTNNPQEAIRSALLREAPSFEKQTSKSLNHLLKSTAPKGKKIVILFDQFEEFFLTNRTPRSRAGFIKWLGETSTDESMPVVFLIGIRADFFAQLQNFAPQIPEPTSIRTTYQLQNFDAEQAKQIFSAAAKADGIPFEPELIQAVIRELESEEFIRPAELQVVGTRLKRKNITRLSQYEVLGGARGILSSYISDEIKQSQNEHSARLVLRLMCADVVETKSQTDLSLDDILNGVSGTEQAGDGKTFGHPEEIQTILNQFVAARVIIHTEDDKYNLVHDYLAPYVRTATEGTETNVERANRMLKRYVAEYKEDPKTRIPFGRVRSIQRFASPEIMARDKAKELVIKSKNAFYMRVAALVTPIILVFAIYSFYLSNSYYLGIENSYIVVYSGLPRLPGSGQLLIQTDLKQDDLVDEKNRNDLNRGNVTGFWFNTVDASKGSYQLWGNQSLDGIGVPQQSQLLRWLGQPHDAERILLNTLTDPQADSNMRPYATQALGPLVQTNPQAVTSNLLQELIDIVTDPEADPSLHSYAADALGVLVQANPQTVTAEMLRELVDIVTHPQADQYASGQALAALAHANPQLVTPEMIQKLIAFATDQQADLYLRYSAMRTLIPLAQANPQAVTSELIQKLSHIVTDQQADLQLRSGAGEALGVLAQANPQSVTSNLLQTMSDIATDQQADLHLRYSAMGTLIPLAQANPQAVTSELIQKLSDIVTDAEADPNLRNSAAPALGSLAQANPQAVPSNLLHKLIDIVTDAEADPILRNSAAPALGSLAQANPKAVTSNLLHKLIDIITDPEADLELRYSAMRTLIPLAQANPKAVTSELIQKLSDIITDPEADFELRSSAAQALAAFVKANPQGVTPEMIQELSNIVSDPQADSYLRFYAAQALEPLVQANPQAVTPEMIQKLSGMVANRQGDPQSDAGPDSYLLFYAELALGPLVRANPQAVPSNLLPNLIDIVTDPYAYNESVWYALPTLESLVQANPQAVTSRMLQQLVDSATDPQADSSDATQALGSLAQANPQAVTTELIQKLIDIVTDPQADPVFRILAARTLASLAQTNPQAILPEMVPQLFAQLSADLDSPGRNAASYALFGIAFSDPNHKKPILAELMELSTNPKPHWRIAANRTLEMIEIGGLLEEARSHPDRIEYFKSRLHYIGDLDDSLHEEHLRFAAGIALKEIEKIEAEAKK